MNDTGSDRRDLARSIRELLDERPLAVAESCTAGALTAALAEAGDADQWLRGGLVAYHETLKRDLLGVTADSVLTTDAARQMAHGVADLLGTDVAVATTGVLGGEPVDGTPPGTVVISTLVGPSTRTHRHHLDDTAEEGRDEAVEQALRQLLDHLRGASD